MASKLALRKQHIPLIIGGLSAVTLAIYVGLIVAPMWKQFAGYSSKIASAKKDLSALKEAVSKEPQLQEQHQKLLASVRVWRQRLPLAGNTSAVIEHISGIASQSGLRIQNITPQPLISPEMAVELKAPRPKDLLVKGSDSKSKSKSKSRSQSKSKAKVPASQAVQKPFYHTLPIQMDALANYHQLGRFIDMLEGATFPMWVVSVRISANSKEPSRHKVRLLVQTYVGTRPPEEQLEQAPQT
jgi:Tfp pilus assembly protein PilO